jgi:two-component system LytT family response regulator
MNVPELRVVIVDDEAPAREILQNLLSAHANVKVIGEANSIANALELCRTLRPNLLFLDVQLGDGEGFDLLPKLSPIPAIIFVTAYDRFAIRAFEVNAIDYLLKPANPARLAHALERITHQPKPLFTGVLTKEDKIFVRVDDKLLLAFVSEISGIEAQENYSLVHLAKGETTLFRRSMAEWESVLPKDLFFRPNRSLIVNREMVQKISMNGRDDVDVDISGFSSPVRLGRKAGVLLRRALNQPNLL